MRSQWIPVGGLLATIAVVGYMVVQLGAQQTAQPADFTKAAAAQIRDAQGQVVLQGPFADPVEEDDGLERRATLTPTGVDADAAGEAEVEYARDAPARQEVEFTAQNLTPDATFTFSIDGTDVVSAKSDRRGRVEVELNVGMPGATPSR